MLEIIIVALVNVYNLIILKSYLSKRNEMCILQHYYIIVDVTPFARRQHRLFVCLFTQLQHQLAIIQ